MGLDAWSGASAALAGQPESASPSARCSMIGRVPPRERRYTPVEELRFQLGVATATQLSREDTSKRMKTCVAGRAICLELVKVIANIFHERQAQAQELLSSSRVGRDRPAPRSAGLGQPSEFSGRPSRVSAAPRRLSLGFGADSRHPPEFGPQTGPPDAPGGTQGVRLITTSGQTLEQVGDHIVEQGSFLERLLGRPSDGDPSSRGHRGALREGTRTDASRPARNQPTGKRRGGNETWHDEMNQRIDRMSRQLSFDSITTTTLSKYKSGWNHWAQFCDIRVQADGTVHGQWMSGADLEKDEKHIINYIAYEGFFANDGKGWAASTIRSKVAAIRFMHTCNY